MEKINLNELFDNNFNCHYAYDTQDEEPAMTKSRFKMVVYEFGKHLLQLAAENANSKDIKEPYCHDHTPFRGECITCGRYDNPYVIIGSEVDKQSILDTIKQIE